MSEFELHQLIYEAINEARSSFDFWLTITLAALASGYYAFSKLDKTLQVIVVSTYAAVALAFLLRWLDAGSVVAKYTASLTNMDGMLPFEGPLSSVAFPLQTMIIIGGSLATTYYLLTIAPKPKGDEQDE